MSLRHPLLVLLGLLLVGSAVRAQDEGGLEAARERLRELEGRIVSAVERVRPAVVTVSVERAGEAGGAREGGSGVIVGAAGEVLTCDHVIEGAERIRVGLADGRRLEAEVVGRDRTGDVALLAIEATELPAVEMGDSTELRRGDPVLALGNPFDLAEDHQPAVSFGIVSGLERFQGGEKVYGAAIQHDAPINPGNSGGPLVDLEGRLVGLNGRISVRHGRQASVGIGFAIPVSQIARFLPDLREGRDVRHGFLGVRLRTGVPGPGAEILEVIPGSPAAEAGILPGDVVVRVSGRAVGGPDRLQSFISVLPEGESVELVVDREGRELRYDVELAARPRGG